MLGVHDRQTTGMDLASLTPLDGGWSGETFLAEVAGERSVVRIYARPSRRGAAAHEVDAALLRLVRGLLPVPEVLEVRRADEATGMPALLVTSFLPGDRLDLLLPRLDGAGTDGRQSRECNRSEDWAELGHRRRLPCMGLATQLALLSAAVEATADSRGGDSLSPLGFRIVSFQTGTGRPRPCSLSLNQPWF